VCKCVGGENEDYDDTCHLNKCRRPDIENIDTYLNILADADVQKDIRKSVKAQLLKGESIFPDFIPITKGSTPEKYKCTDLNVNYRGSISIFPGTCVTGSEVTPYKIDASFCFPK